MKQRATGSQGEYQRWRGHRDKPGWRRRTGDGLMKRKKKNGGRGSGTTKGGRVTTG